MDENKLITKKYYDKNAAKWAVERSSVEYSLDTFIEYQKLLPKGKVIDLGCGACRDAGLFIPAGYDYTGIDLSDGMIEQAKKLYPTAKLLVMDICDLKFPDESFDGIWSYAAYLHIPKKDINHAISEANRILKVGGIGYIVIKRGSFEKYLGEDDEKRYWSFYGKNQFAKILKDNGFEILKFWEYKGERKPQKDLSVFLNYFIKKLK